MERSTPKKCGLHEGLYWFSRWRRLFKKHVQKREGGGITVALLHEPKGWRKLQAMAQREKDPQKLAFIIERMNHLLDRQERMAAEEIPSAGMTRNSENAVKLSVESWQCEVLSGD